MIRCGSIVGGVIFNKEHPDPHHPVERVPTYLTDCTTQGMPHMSDYPERVEWV